MNIVMNINPTHYNRAIKAAIARGYDKRGRPCKWQDVIRHAIELGIDRAVKHATKEDVLASPVETKRIQGRLCPIENIPADEIIGCKPACKDCEKYQR